MLLVTCKPKRFCCCTLSHKIASGAGKPPPVVLSTVHAAKGQEWDTVFVIGVEASLFPHSRSMIPDEDKPAGRDSPIDEVSYYRVLDGFSVHRS